MQSVDQGMNAGLRSGGAGMTRSTNRQRSDISQPETGRRPGTKPIDDPGPGEVWTRFLDELDHSIATVR
jgi:hypothetical protein